MAFRLWRADFLGSSCLNVVMCRQTEQQEDISCRALCEDIWRGLLDAVNGLQQQKGCYIVKLYHYIASGHLADAFDPSDLLSYTHTHIWSWLSCSRTLQQMEKKSHHMTNGQPAPPPELRPYQTHLDIYHCVIIPLVLLWPACVCTSESCTEPRDHREKR